MKFFIKNFFSKCDQVCSFLQVWSHLLKKSLMENFSFCTVTRKYRLTPFHLFSHAVPEERQKYYERDGRDRFFSEIRNDWISAQNQCSDMDNQSQTVPTLRPPSGLRTRRKWLRPSVKPNTVNSSALFWLTRTKNQKILKIKI